MKIRVKKTLPNNVRGPIILMAKHNGQVKTISVNPGSEFDIEDAVGNKLLGEYCEILEVISYGSSGNSAPKNRMVSEMETK